MKYKTGKYSVQKDGTSKTIDAGIVETFNELADYINGYKHYLHSQPFIILSADLNKQYAKWQIEHAKHRSEERQKALARLLGTGAGIATGNTKTIAYHITKFFGQIAGDIVYESNNETFMTLERHYQENYDDGRLGICLHCTETGRPFTQRYRGRARLGEIIASSLSKTRPV